MYDLQPESKHITLFKLQLRISNRIRVSCSEVDEPRACYTELSKSGREKQIWCINAHIHIPYHAEAEAPKLWPPDVKSRLFGKDPDAGKDWGQEEKGETEDEMVGWITDSMDMSLKKLWERVKEREAWCATGHGVAKN